jgi:two-component system chemotaxis response regulator CheY
MVLMDRNMPELDGITCMKKLVKKHPETRFIIVSGYEDSGSHSIDQEIRELISGYLVKPIGLETLGEVLSQALTS